MIARLVAASSAEDWRGKTMSNVRYCRNNKDDELSFPVVIAPYANSASLGSQGAKGRIAVVGMGIDL